MSLRPPVRPKKPVLEDVKGLPDQKHNWLTYGDLDGSDDTDIHPFAGIDQDYHNGPRCKLCDFTECEHCHPEMYEDADCLRDQADNRNRKRTSDYEAKMR